MRQTVGNTFIFKLVIIFTFLFACFLALTITYNKAFKIKNEMLSVIEKYEGINNNSLTVINNYLTASGYTTKGKCKSIVGENKYGVKSLEAIDYELVSDNENYYYCFTEKNVSTTINPQKTIKLNIFYNFNLPVVGDLFKYEIVGETNTINTHTTLGALYR